MSYRIWSKKSLCILFGLYSTKTGQCYYNRLRKKILTDDVLYQAGIALEEYTRIRTFTAEQSRKLTEILDLPNEEKEDLATSAGDT